MEPLTMSEMNYLMQLVRQDMSASLEPNKFKQGIYKKLEQMQGSSVTTMRLAHKLERLILEQRQFQEVLEQERQFLLDEEKHP